MRAHAGFTWLADTFTCEIWPPLAGLVCRDEQATGQFVQPLSRCVCVLLRAQVGVL